MGGDSKKNILVVDDDMITLTAIRKILEKKYNVSLAKSAKQAWEILNDAPIDLMLLDVEMPEQSGLEFISYLQSNEVFTHVPVIFVTSHSTPDILKKAIGSGAKSFIAKPAEEKLLLEKVNAVLSKAAPPTEREKIIQRLHLIDIACKADNIQDMEKHAKELQTMKYNVGTDTAVSIICKEVSFHNKFGVTDKIEELLNNNLFDVKRSK